MVWPGASNHIRRDGRSIEVSRVQCGEKCTLPQNARLHAKGIEANIISDCRWPSWPLQIIKSANPMALERGLGTSHVQLRAGGTQTSDRVCTTSATTASTPETARLCPSIVKEQFRVTAWPVRVRLTRGHAGLAIQSKR